MLILSPPPMLSPPRCSAHFDAQSAPYDAQPASMLSPPMHGACSAYAQPASLLPASMTARLDAQPASDAQPAQMEMLSPFRCSVPASMLSAGLDAQPLCSQPASMLMMFTASQSLPEPPAACCTPTKVKTGVRPQGVQRLTRSRSTERLTCTCHGAPSRRTSQPSRNKDSRGRL